MNIDVITSSADFRGLEAEWASLLDHASDASVFSTWQWQFTWWTYYGQSQPLRILRAIENDETVGLLPLYIDTIAVAKVLRARVLRLVGTGGDTDPDYLGAIVSDHHRERVCAAFADYILNNHGEWDVCELSDLRDDSALARAIKQRASAGGVRLQDAVSARIWYAPLPSSWEEYLQRLSSERRYQIRSRRRKFERLGQARFAVATQPQELDPVFDDLVRLHRLRWQGRVERFSFSSPEYVGFHRDVIHACARQGWIRLCSLSVNGRRVAVYYFYVFRGTLFHFQSSFDPDYGELRPGAVLLGYTIQQAIEEGCTTLDLLRGEHDYKRQWASECRKTFAIIRYRNTPAATLMKLRRHFVPGVMKRVRNGRAQVDVVWNRLNGVGTAACAK